MNHLHQYDQNQPKIKQTINQCSQSHDEISISFAFMLAIVMKPKMTILGLAYYIPILAFERRQKDLNSK
jgi:hypothetical protein